MNEAMRNDDQMSRTYRDIDKVQARKRERQSKGNNIPDTIEYEGEVLDTDRLIEGLLMIYARNAEKLQDESSF